MECFHLIYTIRLLLSTWILYGRVNGDGQVYEVVRRGYRVRGMLGIVYVSCPQDLPPIYDHLLFKSTSVCMFNY